MKINDETKKILNELFGRRIVWNDGHEEHGVYFECFGISGVSFPKLKVLVDLFGSDDLVVDFADNYGDYSTDISVGRPTKGVE